MAWRGVDLSITGAEAAYAIPRPANMGVCTPARNVGSGGMGPSGDPHSGEIPAFCRPPGFDHVAREVATLRMK